MECRRKLVVKYQKKRYLVHAINLKALAHRGPFVSFLKARQCQGLA